MRLTPTVIQRLREAKGRILLPSAVNVLVAAVEQELAAKDAEIAELRKRPTLDEVVKALRGMADVDLDGSEHAIACTTDLYRRKAEQARAEAPK